VLEAIVFPDGTEPVANIPSLGYIVVEKDLQFYNIAVLMRLANAVAALVVQGEVDMPGSVVGIIGPEQIAEIVSHGAESLPF
jgi:hypothetical protein